jgi:hypothetical protein
VDEEEENKPAWEWKMTSETEFWSCELLQEDFT